MHVQDFVPVELCNLEYDPARGAAIEPHKDDEWWASVIVVVVVVVGVVVGVGYVAYCCCCCCRLYCSLWATLPVLWTPLK